VEEEEDRGRDRVQEISVQEISMREISVQEERQVGK